MKIILETIVGFFALTGLLFWGLAICWAFTRWLDSRPSDSTEEDQS